jgi:kynureninase
MLGDLFAVHNGIYLLNHSVGRPLVSAREYTEKHYFDVWESGQAEVWNSWLPIIEDFRSAIAKIYNTDASYVCPQVNLSSALTKILSALPREKNKMTILLSEEDFPSIVFVLKMAEQNGYKLKFIPKGSDLLDIQTWDQHMSADVGLALVSHVYSNTGVKAPVFEITSLCQQKKIFSIVDIAQSAGVVQIDFQKWQSDFVIGSCVKWLCGGSGAAYLWVNPRLLHMCKPTDVGWFSHQNPFEFDIHSFTYADSALRFWGGTPSVMPYVVATNSINTLANIGVGVISQHNIKLSQLLIDQIEDRHIVSPRHANQRGGTVVLHFGNQQEAVLEKLTQANVRFDSRPHGLRLSPHIYNTQDEIEEVSCCLRNV